MATTNVRITASKDASVQRAIKGVTDDTRKARDKITKHDADATRKEIDNAKKALVKKGQTAEALARAEIGSAKKSEREKRRLSDKLVRDTARNAEKERREAEKTARAIVASARKAAREKKRISDKELRDIQRNASTARREAEKTARSQLKSAQSARRAALAGGAGAAFGAARGAAALAARGQGVAGVQSIEQRLANAKQIRDVLIGTASESLGKGGTDESLTKMTDELTTLVVQVSKQYQIDAVQLAGALSEAQTGFAKLEDFAAILPEIAALTKASVGSDAADFVNLFGVLTDAFGLTLDEMRQLPGIIKETSAEGAISPKELAEAFGPALKFLSSATGRTGIGAVREALATAQVLGTSKARAPEVATFLEQMTRQLQRPAVREGLAKVGVQVSEESEDTLSRARRGRKAREGAFSGNLLPIGDIIRSLQANQEVLRKPGALTAIGIPEDVAKAFIFAMQSGTKFADVARAAGGQSDINRVVRALTSGPQGRLAQLRVNAQAATIADADRIIDAMAPGVKKMTELQSEFPILTESLGLLTETVKFAVGALVANRIAGGGLPGLGGGGGGGKGGPGGKLGAGGGLSKILKKAAVVGTAFELTQFVLNNTAPGKAVSGGLDKAARFLGERNEKALALRFGTKQDDGILANVRKLAGSDIIGQSVAADRKAGVTSKSELTIKVDQSGRVTGLVVRADPSFDVTSEMGLSLVP